MSESLYHLNFATRAVLGAVTPSRGTPRTHAVGRGSGRVVCGTVDPSHLADVHATPEHVLPTCSRCLVRLQTILKNGR
jgi:hypothetical protein